MAGVALMSVTHPPSPPKEAVDLSYLDRDGAF